MREKTLGGAGCCSVAGCQTARTHGECCIQWAICIIMAAPRNTTAGRQAKKLLLRAGRGEAQPCDSPSARPSVPPPPPPHGLGMDWHRRAEGCANHTTPQHSTPAKHSTAHHTTPGNSPDCTREWKSSSSPRSVRKGRSLGRRRGRAVSQSGRQSASQAGSAVRRAGLIRARAGAGCRGRRRDEEGAKWGGVGWGGTEARRRQGRRQAWHVARAWW